MLREKIALATSMGTFAHSGKVMPSAKHSRASLLRLCLNASAVLIGIPYAIRYALKFSSIEWLHKKTNGSYSAIMLEKFNFSSVIVAL